MTDEELHRLSRSELPEMLIIETKENARLRSELEQARAELADRRILLGNCGSMAEAALRLNGVFEAVDKAAFQKKTYYLGAFDRIEDAIKARKRGEKMHNDFLKRYYEEHHGKGQREQERIERN